MSALRDSLPTREAKLRFDVVGRQSDAKPVAGFQPETSPTPKLATLLAFVQNLGLQKTDIICRYGELLRAGN
jgi:hypothetical protein